MNKNNDLNQRVLDNLEAMSAGEDYYTCETLCKDNSWYDCYIYVNGVCVGRCQYMTNKN